MDADYVGFGKAIESELQSLTDGFGSQIDLLYTLFAMAAEHGLVNGQDVSGFGRVYFASGRAKGDPQCHMCLVAAEEVTQAADLVIRNIMEASGIVDVEPIDAIRQGLVSISTPCPLDPTGTYQARLLYPAELQTLKTALEQLSDTHRVPAED